MNVLADKYLYKLDELLPAEADLTLFDPDAGFPGNAADADVLLIRTVTGINAQTLPKAGRLKFIGSATAGFDHVDREHLLSLGVGFSSSEGCNANAVGEYVITVLYRWSHLRKKNPGKLTVGIAGCGNTGGSVQQYLAGLGIKTVLYDPPKSIRDKHFKSDTLESLLACDVLTFHTPLTFTGEHATHHLCSAPWFEYKFQLIINAARGGVVDEQALLKAASKGLVEDFILDVWENEPLFSNKCAQRALIATPHIAGYSKQAKFRATDMIVEKMCRFFGLNRERPKSKADKTGTEICFDEKFSTANFLWQNSNIQQYDEKLRELIGLPEKEKALKFAKLRSETETRDEFGAIVRGLDSIPGNLSNIRVFAQDDAVTRRGF